jgi:hypothetical protein
MQNTSPLLMVVFTVLLVAGMMLVWLGGGPLYAQDGGSTTLIPDEAIAGNIEIVGEQDEYFFDGTGGTRIELEMDAIVNSPLVPALVLEDIDGNELASGSQTGSVILAITLPASSTYRVLASGYGDTTGSYRLELRLLQVSTSTPPGPTVMSTSTLPSATATPIGTLAPTVIPAGASRSGRPLEINSVVSGRLVQGRWDVWQFEATANQSVTIVVTSSEFDSLLEMFGPSDSLTPLYTDDDGGRGTNSMLYNIALAQAGTYQIYVRSFENDGSGAYVLSLQSGTGRSVSVENSNPLVLGEIVQGSLSAQEAVYYFDAEAGERITIFLTSAHFDTYLELLDAEGELISENDDDGRTSNSVIDVELSAAGIYFIVVSAYELDSIGDFELEAYRLDSIESPGGTIAVGETVRARLLPETAAEWNFQAGAGEIISIAAMPQNPIEQLDLLIELMDADGRVLIDDDDAGLALNPQIVDLVIPAAGQYRIRVREASATIGGRYLLALGSGRVYFSPHGKPASIVVLENGAAWVANTVDEVGESYQLWVIPVTEIRLLTIQLLAATEGNNFPGDFELRLFNTNWDLVAESTTGILTVENIAPPTDFLLLVRFRGIGVQPYQMQFSNIAPTQ